MGVQNLLPLIQGVSKRCRLDEYKGKRVAIDGFVWLHRSSYRCSRELVNDPSSEAFLPFVMHKIQKVISCGLTPVVVFDGQSLPQKANTNSKRHKDRAEAKERALLLDSQGQSDLAVSFYQKAVEITSATVYTWIKQLRKIGVEYIVAPYEADAQLAYLCRTHYVDCVMTEDSDLLAYQTPLILFKYDDYSQTVMSVKLDDVLSHLQLTAEQFIAVCCLSGCDYMEHINRLGIQTALKLIRAHSDPYVLLDVIRKEGKFNVPENYEEQLKNAMLTFQAQKVYDPREKTLKTLTPVDEAPDFLGANISRELLLKIVSGKIDAKTHENLAPSLTFDCLTTKQTERSQSQQFDSQSQQLNPQSQLSAESQPVPFEKKSQSQYFNFYRAPTSKKRVVPQKQYSAKSIQSYFQKV
ncbi:DNA damage-inducible protein DIN7 [Tritrichomonas foetus]|uniref:DNA damage-inducible protein DIN7 n=1 Tax=Tritrichomonas foetus TaxID=1144522 RepID=A0A1J4JMM8_9EUKA|nr:DNA damage-inducible protein DIN7 [Tritrichomonas foetus]|eukprot:OHS99953.1 DNA damage-inducible protein DIN7 [Tritrichomonas foetus]